MCVCACVARLQTEVLPPSGVLGFCETPGGLSGGLQIEGPVTTALQTLHWLIPNPQRGRARMEVEETMMNVQEKVPQMMHPWLVLMISSHLYLKREF